MEHSTPVEGSSQYFEDMNIIDALFIKHQHYIVLLSGLVPELEAIAEDVAKSLGFTHLCFMHIKTDYDPVNKRVQDMIDQKKQGLIVCGPTFPSDKLGFRVDLHIHLSITRTMANEKDDKIDYEAYLESVKTNRINKYINVKPGYDVAQLGDAVFDVVIANIDGKVHVKKNI